MPPQTARSLMKDFRNSFRRKKVVVEAVPKVEASKEAEKELQAKLSELKESMGNSLPSMYEDAELVGFLRARSFNIKETEKLIKTDESIRKILRVEEYEPNKELSSYNSTGFIGFDKEGSAARVINLGYLDAKGITHRVSTIEGLKILINMVNIDKALQEEENKKKGRCNKQLVYILNLENLSMNQITCKPAFDSVMQALRLLQDHYHDLFKTIYFVNAPSFFSSVFKLFKPAIQESLQEKIKILDNGNWKEELLKEFDPDVLPAYLGGERVDKNGDPSCSEFISFGGIVPEDKYASNFLDEDDPEVTTVTLAAGATLNFRFPVRQAGSTFTWHVQSKDNDLAMGVFLEPFPSGNETPRTRKKGEEDLSQFEALTPVIRTQCHICPEEGSTVLWFTGNLILHLDNSYSWMNSKEVMFKLSLLPPSKTVKKNVETGVLSQTETNL